MPPTDACKSFTGDSGDSRRSMLNSWHFHWDPWLPTVSPEKHAWPREGRIGTASLFCRKGCASPSRRAPLAIPGTLKAPWDPSPAMSNTFRRAEDPFGKAATYLPTRGALALWPTRGVGWTYDRWRHKDGSMPSRRRFQCDMLATFTLYTKRRGANTSFRNCFLDQLSDFGCADPLGWENRTELHSWESSWASSERTILNGGMDTRMSPSFSSMIWTCLTISWLPFSRYGPTGMPLQPKWRADHWI